MKKTTFQFFSLIMIIFISCKPSEKIMVDGKELKDWMKIKYDPDYVQPVSNAAFTIEDWSIENDIAKLIINYSGGCATHLFNAYFTGLYTNDSPAKAGIFIEHENGADKCRMLVIDTIYINLKPVRLDKDKPGTVIIGFNNSGKTVEYIYK